MLSVFLLLFKLRNNEKENVMKVTKKKYENKSKESAIKTKK